MVVSNLPIELKTDITDSDIDFYIMIEDRINELSKGHSDITGAAATLERPASGRETDYIIEANVVVYARPNNINATEKHESPVQALKKALDAIERQVREKRNRLNEDRGSLDNFWVATEDERSENDEDDDTTS